jgi:hypothetical protein
MKIQVLHEHFEEKIATITEYQRAARSLANSELAKLSAYIERKSASPEEFKGPMSSMNMSYRSPIDGQQVRYGHRVRSVEEVKESLELHLNKQFQWLFAEAYEEFEDFVEAAYASAGYFDHAFWPLSDFGNITIAEMPKAGWDWYLAQSGKKKNKPESTLTQFRARLPEFAELERSNALNVDLRFWLALITQLRHHIVHTSGKVRNRTEFSQKVFKAAGIGTQGAGSAEYDDLIESCFYLPPHAEIIAMLDRPYQESSSRLPLYISTFDELIGKILATACCLRTSLERHQSER